MPGRDPCLSLHELLVTMQALRAPGGCPWDAGQTPESLTPYIIEEACEAVEAIETGEPARVLDELGDLLLQIVFQAQIFAERRQFDFADIAAAITMKLRRRHPHVFAGDNSAGSTEELARQWERIKQAEQAGQSAAPHSATHIPDHLPALQRAQKLVSRVRRGSFTTNRLSPCSADDIGLSEEALGWSLLTLVQQAEACGLDAEQALRRLLQKLVAEGCQLADGERSGV
jgi:MazG family protein